MKQRWVLQSTPKVSELQITSRWVSQRSYYKSKFVGNIVLSPISFARGPRFQSQKVMDLSGVLEERLNRTVNLLNLIDVECKLF